MIFDVLHALKSRRSSTSILQREIERLQSLKSSNSQRIDPRHERGTFILSVLLQPSERKVMFFVGQTFETPMGSGLLAAIFPETRCLHIKLPVYYSNFGSFSPPSRHLLSCLVQFGIMYTNIMNVLSWGLADLSSGK